MSRSLDESFVGYLSESPGLALGPPIFGLFLDGFLLAGTLGLALLWQVRLASTDSRVDKILVYYLVACSTAHSALCLATCMDAYVTHSGDYAIWIDGWWWKGQNIFELLIVFPVEVFFINRAYQVWDRSRVVLSLLTLPLLAWTSLIISILAVYPTNWRYGNGAIIWAFIGTLLVASWAVSITIMLGLYRKRGEFLQSRLLVKRIITISAETQLVPSVIAFGFVVVSVFSAKNNLLWAFMSAPKLSALACLVVIYSRFSLRADVERHRSNRQVTFEHDLYPSNVACLPSSSGRIDSGSKGIYSLSHTEQISNGEQDVLSIELSRPLDYASLSGRGTYSEASQGENRRSTVERVEGLEGDVDVGEGGNGSEVSFGQMFR